MAKKKMLDEDDLMLDGGSHPEFDMQDTA